MDLSSVSAPEAGNCGADATALWAAEQSALIRGLAHALSNRVGTIVAVAGMLAPGAPAPAPIVGMLAEEGDRLEELLGMLRLLGGEDGAAEPEPLHLPDVVAPIVTLHAHHPEWRDVPCLIVPDPAAPPVRVHRDGLTRALLVLLSAVKRGAGGARITTSAAPRAVILAVDGQAGDANVARAAAQLLDAPVVPNASGYAMELPPL